jgi:hypothetical protein
MWLVREADRPMTYDWVKFYRDEELDTAQERHEEDTD